jgi:hypothetical protein
VSSGWIVHIEGLPGPDHFYARDLADIEPRALKLIWGFIGIDHDRIDLDIQLRLPGAIQDRLDIIRQHCADIEAEYDAATVEMVEMGLSLLDVSWVLALHHATPRPRTVSNAELAEHGLDHHPDAVGVEWDDHGFALTRTCRRHVDASRRNYRDADPHALNALVYPGAAFCCDLCHEGDDRTNGWRPAREP